MTKTITEFETLRGNRLIDSEITTPVVVFAGRTDKVNMRWFKIVSRDVFLEDLFEATEFDMRSEEPEKRLEFFSAVKNGIKIDVTYFGNLEVARVIQDIDGIELVPAVLQGPHANLLLTLIDGNDENLLRLRRAIQKKFRTDAVLKTNRRTVEKNRSVRLAAVRRRRA